MCRRRWDDCDGGGSGSVVVAIVIVVVVTVVVVVMVVMMILVMDYGDFASSRGKIDRNRDNIDEIINNLSYPVL